MATITNENEIETGRKLSTRGQALADRIEEGASGLAAFAEGLSEAEWRTPVSATDGRTVGVIVHHVASMFLSRSMSHEPLRAARLSQMFRGKLLPE